MPILATRLETQIKSNLLSEFLKLGGKKTDAQARLAKAIAAGFAAGFIGAKGTIGAPAGTGSSTVGLLGVTLDELAKEILKEIKEKLESEGGSATMPFAKAIAKSVVAELKQARIVGASGGRAAKFKSKGAQLMAKAMLGASGFTRTEQNEKMFLAISSAMTTVVEAKGYAVIPPAGPTPAGPLATLS